MALVLVVDDSKTARRYAGAILAAAGHEVLEAADVEEALDRMADRPPDCVVLDLMMPGLSGFELMQVLGGRSAPTPVVVVTASLDERDRARCAGLGARAFVQKPVAAAELTRAVAQAIAGAAARVPPGAGLAR